MNTFQNAIRNKDFVVTSECFLKPETDAEAMRVHAIAAERMRSRRSIEDPLVHTVRKDRMLQTQRSACYPCPEYRVNISQRQTPSETRDSVAPRAVCELARSCG